MIPEFDTPGHSLSWGPGAGDGFLTACYEGDKPTGTFGPIDPTFKSNYDLMIMLYSEVWFL